MKNNFDSFKEATIKLSDWLDSIPPFQYSLYASILGYIISSFLKTGALNALGNWFEQLGQIMLTIAAQASATPTNDEYNALIKDIENLKKQLDELKKNS